jgi:hypothetical protein
MPVGARTIHDCRAICSTRPVVALGTYFFPLFLPDDASDEAFEASGLAELEFSDFEELSDFEESSDFALLSFFEEESPLEEDEEGAEDFLA